MAKRIIALWGDDWELRGNGFGNVAHLQYLPALYLINLARDFEIPLTFFVETMQQVVFEAHAPKHRDLAIQARLWRESIGLILDAGHDVQLHIHPHWSEAQYQGDYFRVGKNWNLATYPEATRRDLLRQCHAYLSEVTQSFQPTHQLHTYKAGAWAMSPSAGLLQDLSGLGIRCAIGVSPGMLLQHPDFHLDYRDVEEDTLPWYPQPEDVCRVGSVSALPIILPAAHYQVDMPLKAALLWRKLSSRFQPAANRYSYHRALPKEVTTHSPLLNATRDRIFKKLLKRYSAHLDLGAGQSFYEQRRAFDQIVARLGDHPAHTAPLVLESHSKMMEGHWDTLRRFIAYVRDQHSDIEFQSMSQYLRLLEEEPEQIRSIRP